MEAANFAALVSNLKACHSGVHDTFEPAGHRPQVEWAIQQIMRDHRVVTRLLDKYLSAIGAASFECLTEDRIERLIEGTTSLEERNIRSAECFESFDGIVLRSRII